MFSVKVAKKLQISTQFTKREKFPLLYLALEHKFLRVVRQSADKAHTYSRNAERRLCCRLWTGRGCGSACLRVCESERERKRETVSFSRHFFPGWSASVVSLCSPQCCLSHFYTQPVAKPNKNSVGERAVCASTYRCSKLLSCAVIALDFYPCIASLAPLLLLLLLVLHLPPISHIKDAIDVIKSSSRNIIVQFLPHRCIRQTHPHLPPKMEVYFQTFFFF